MKIASIEATPIFLPTRKPYRWAFGVKHGAVLVLLKVTTDAGVEGYGECIGTPSAEAICAYFEKIRPLCIGRSPFDINALTSRIYDTLLRAVGPSSAPRFGAQLLAGMDMALWDVVGKAMGRPVYDLLGGVLRDKVDYFGFVQGESPEELASHATELKAAGCKVIYVKIGRGEALDMAIVHAVRAAIGDSRLRLDANEAWDVLTAARMTRALAPFNPEMIEQPTNSEHPAALARVKANSPIPIAADQGVFTPADVYGVCTSGSADLIVLGLHEAGSIARFQKAAAIAEVAGLNLCIHGKMESGITTCASNQVAATIANLDDGNQYMNGLLAEDIVKQPALTLENGALPLSKLPGLGFEVDTDAIGQAAERYRIEHEKGQI